MSDEYTNVVLVMSDEHRPDALGSADHPLVETPALDRVAAAGTRFSSAYCPSPLCAPSRASFATGRYVHETSCWDNATPYAGKPRSWGHHFSAHGVDVTTVGKLDFEPGSDDGFDDQRLPAHRETPDVNGLERDPPGIREGARARITNAGPSDGEPWYHEAEEARTEAAVSFLEARAAELAGGDGDPWLLWVNYIVPHFPLRVAPEYYERYPLDEMDLPVDSPAGDAHPILEELRDHFDGRDLDEATLRRTRAAYYGLCSALDDHVGRIAAALDRLGLAEDTLFIYTSDHGEPLGDHDLWWKCCMYEPSVGIPFLVRGPGVDAGRVVDSPVSLLDVVPTAADALGVPTDPAWRGRSLWPVLQGERGPDANRAVFSEYHAHGTSRGAFMLRRGRYKYVYYPDNPAQLFDRAADPDETENLAAQPGYAEVVERFEAELAERVDPGPDAVDARARRDQRERRAALESGAPYGRDRFERDQ